MPLARIVAMLLPALVVGCADARVDVEGPPTFGPVGSALLVEVVHPERGTAEHIVLSDQLLFCGAYAAAWRASRAVDEASLQAWAGMETEAEFCEEAKRAYAAKADIWAGIHDTGHRTLSVIVEDFSIGPLVGFVPAGDGATQFSARLDYYTGNPYEGLARAVDCDAVPIDWDGWDDHTETWTAHAGGFSHDRDTNRVTLGAHIHDEEGVNLGTLTASAALTPCPIEVE